MTLQERIKLADLAIAQAELLDRVWRNAASPQDVARLVEVRKALGVELPLFVRRQTGAPRQAAGRRRKGAGGSL